MSKRQIIIQDHRFNTVKAAADFYGFKISTFRKRLRKYGPNDPRLIAKLDPSRGYKVNVNGHKFSSIQQAAKHFKVSKSAVNGRIRRGEDPNNIYTYRPEGSNHKKSIMYHGKKYKSIRQLSLETGINAHTISFALDANISLDSLTPANNPTKPKGFTYQGIYYESLEKAAKKANLSPATIANRLRQPHALERNDLFAPIGKYQRNDRKKITYDGKTYPSIAAMAKANDLTPSCLSSRIRREGINSPYLLRPQSQATNPLANAKPITILGINYDSVSQAARENGFRKDTFRKRLKKYGCNDPRVFQSLQSQKDYMAKPVTYRGHKFSSIKDMADYYHINENAIAARMRHYGHNDPRVIENLKHASKEHLRIKK